MRRLAVCASLLLLSAAVHATVIVPIEFRELVTASPVIAHGHVTDARAAFVNGRQSVETFVTVAVDEYLRGNLGEHVTFRVPGGQLGRYNTVFVGAPSFREGDEVVVFLKTPSRGVPVITGLNQGAFRVLPDAAGRHMVTAPILMGKSATDAEPVVRGDAARRPLTIESFRDVVRQVLSEAGQQ